MVTTGTRLNGYIVNVMCSPVIERLLVRGSQVTLKHVFHDMEIRTLVMELRRRAIKRWVSCGDMDRRLKIPHSAKVECGFRTTPEECLCDSGLNGLHYRASQYNTIQYNTIQYNTIQYNTIQYNTIQYNTIQTKLPRQYNIYSCRHAIQTMSFRWSDPNPD